MGQSLAVATIRFVPRNQAVSVQRGSRPRVLPRDVKVRDGGNAVGADRARRRTRHNTATPSCRPFGVADKMVAIHITAQSTRRQSLRRKRGSIVGHDTLCPPLRAAWDLALTPIGVWQVSTHKRDIRLTPCSRSIVECYGGGSSRSRSRRIWPSQTPLAQPSRSPQASSGRVANPSVSTSCFSRDWFARVGIHSVLACFLADLGRV